MEGCFYFLLKLPFVYYTCLITAPTLLLIIVYKQMYFCFLIYLKQLAKIEIIFFFFIRFSRHPRLKKITFVFAMIEWRVTQFLLL